MSCGCGCGGGCSETKPAVLSGFSNVASYANQDSRYEQGWPIQTRMTPGSVGHFASFGPPPSIPANPYAPMWAEVGMKGLRGRVGRVGHFGGRLGRAHGGVGDYFGPTQTQLLPGVSNEMLAGGVVAGVLLLMAIR